MFIFTIPALFCQTGQSEYQKYFDSADEYLLACDYQKAIGELEKVLSSGNKRELREAHYSIGHCYEMLNEYTMAITHYEKVLDHYPNEVKALEKAGVLYFNYGPANKRMESGLKYVLKAEEAGSVNMHIYFTAACIFSLQKKTEKAVLYLDKAFYYGYDDIEGLTENSDLSNIINLPYCQRLIDNALKFETAESYFRKAQQYSGKNADYDKMLENYELALQNYTLSLGKESLKAAKIYTIMGSVYDEKGEYDKADELLIKAIEIAKKCGARQEAIIYANNLGLLYLQHKNYQKAKIFFEEAIAVIEEARSQVGSGKAEFMARNIESYLYSLKTSALLNDTRGVFAASEAMRARGFLDRLSLSAALSAEGIHPAQRQQMIARNDELESLVRQRESELKKEAAQQDRNKLVRLTDAILAKEKEFQAMDGSLMKNERYKNLRRPKIADLDAAQKLCTDRSAILEYVIWDDGTNINRQSYCIVITNKGSKVVALDSEFYYSEWVEKFREAVMGSVYNPEYIDEPAALLYAKLIAPVEKLLTGVESLIIVPDGPLAFLPFDVLKEQAKSPFLCEKYAITLSPSVSVMIMVKGRSYKQDKKELLAFGGAIYAKQGGGLDRGKVEPKKERQLTVIEKQSTAKTASIEGLNAYYEALGYTWDNLPGTLEEVKQITGQVYGNKGTLLINGADVSEKKVKELSKGGELKNYKVIHFACHGYYEQSYPSFSSIIFCEVSKSISASSSEDGYLNVEEVALLSLEAELVNLSACETGLGEIVQGDGVIGLTRALFTAGTNRVGVTLWSVADDATCEFMVRVYTRVVQDKKSFEQAYHLTKLEFIKSDKFASPYFWSPFVLYGKF